MKAEPWTPCWKFVISMDYSVSVAFLLENTSARQQVSKPDNIAFGGATNPKENLSVVNPVINTEKSKNIPGAFRAWLSEQVQSKLGFSKHQKLSCFKWGRNLQVWV